MKCRGPQPNRGEREVDQGGEQSRDVVAVSLASARCTKDEGVVGAARERDAHLDH